MADIYTHLDTVAEVAPHSQVATIASGSAATEWTCGRACAAARRLLRQLAHPRRHRRLARAPTNMNDFAPGADLDVVVLPHVLLRAFVRFCLRRADERTPDEG
jgi:hypothetical protein